ncbi:hypothetical protein HN020_03210 [Brevibacillus borstelensis]|uniref:hypothetical protein n=1 Tax=Brevibacillus TaxID=55080 RepID=UPI00148F7259|nr:hypothetical protein [Brevibacillus borstelensis]MCC0566253.1 hypothetical protein [Brevibacillus borstelensis]MED1854791.1 hypothetical protein [Brevibacillus borstelensis]NOU53807.1 hypothetical protein [Brevibacillus borstelensis]
MARRSKPYITQFFNRDRLAFTAMFKVGHVTREHLYQCGLADSRIKNLLRDGHIEKIAYKHLGKTEECYKLTKSGRGTATRLWGLEQAYKAQSPAHDLSLANKYFSLSEEIRNSWKTEAQVRDEFIERINAMRDEGKEVEAKLYEDMLNKRMISMPDCVYVDEKGNEIAYEVVTDSYGMEEMRAKEALVEIMNYKYEAVRV